jgi:hypothetical protein
MKRRISISLFAALFSTALIPCGYAILPEPGNIYYGTARNVFGIPYGPGSQAKILMVRVIGPVDKPDDQIEDDDIILAESPIIAPSAGNLVNFILRPSLDGLGGTRYIASAGRENDPVILLIEDSGIRYAVASTANCTPVSDIAPDLGPRGTIREVSIRAIDDIDGDCLADTWEAFFFGGNGFGQSEDPDGDGSNNLTEFIDGTNPLIPDRIDISLETRGLAITRNGNSLTVDWPRDLARSYTLEWATGLSEFVEIPANKLSGERLNIIDVSGLTQIFVRLRVSR